MEVLAALSSFVLAIVLATPEALGRYANDFWALSAGPAVILHVIRCCLVWLHEAVARWRRRNISQLLDKSEEMLHQAYNLLTDKKHYWLNHEKLFLDLQEESTLRQYDLFRAGNTYRASPILKILQGPVQHIAGASQAATEKGVSLCEIMKIDIERTERTEESLARHPDMIKVVLGVNAITLKFMRRVISDSGVSTLNTFDRLMRLIDKNNEVILQHGTAINNGLTRLADVIAKRQGMLDGLVMAARSDILIALINVPPGWETVEARNGNVARNSEPGRRSQGLLAGGLPSGADVPADIVDNVYELSRMFRPPSKETAEDVVQDPSLLSQAKDPQRSAQVDPQQTEELNELRKAQEDLEKLRTKIERLQRDQKTSRTDQEATAKDQESEATNIFASKVKACLEKDMLELSGSMRERWQRYVRSITGSEGKQPETITPATAIAHPTTSTDCGNTATTIIG